MLATSTGGVGRHVRSLAAGLVARGLEVTVIGPAATEALFEFSAVGAVMRPVEIAAGPRPVTAGRAVLRLRRLLGARQGPDLVHAHGLRAGLVAGLATPPGRPLVVTWHNAVLGGTMGGRLHARLERLVAGRADVTLAASPDLLARAWRLGGRDVRPTEIAAPALPSPRRSPALVRRDLDAGDRPLVLAVGRLHPQKGYDVLLASAARWARRMPTPLLAVAGDGPLEADLRARVDREDLPVRLLGRRADVADLLAAADVVVLASRWEARALIAQEALRAGRPLVATAVGGLPELVGTAARLVPPENPDALAAAVGGLLDDPAAASLLGERGRRRAASWATEADTVASAAALYAELLGPVG